MALSINISDDKKPAESNSGNKNISTKRSSNNSNGDLSKRRKLVRSPKKSKVEVKAPSRESNNRKPKKKRSKKKLFTLALIVILVGAGIFAVLRLRSFSKEIGIKITPKDIIEPVKKDPELKKDGTGIHTNVLMVGIDTRETDQGLQNTDTIMVASYNHQSSEVTMISIPRDTYAAIPDTENYVKINGIYNYVEQQEEGSGLEGLKGVVEDYTGLDIQYYGMVDVKGLRNIIDILGGVEVDVENSFTDYAYPNEEDPYREYQTVSFVAGPQTMDGDTAVKYARSRKSLMNGEGTDFARARRQQKLIEAMKDKVLSTETLLSPQKLLDIMVEVEENIKVSEFTNEDIQAGIKILKENPDTVVHSFVLDPYVGGRKVITEGAIPNSYGLTPVEGIGVYDQVHTFIKEILANPELYEEDPLIYVYDIGNGYYETYEETTLLQEKFPFLRIIYQGTLYSDKQGSFIYDNSVEGEFVQSPEFLLGSVGESANQKPEFLTTRLNGEDVTILMGAPLPEPEPEPQQEGVQDDQETGGSAEVTQ